MIAEKLFVELGKYKMRKGWRWFYETGWYKSAAKLKQTYYLVYWRLINTKAHSKSKQALP